MEGCQELENYNKDAEEVNSSNSMDESVIIRIIVMQTMVADDMAKDWGGYGGHGHHWQAGAAVVPKYNNITCSYLPVPNPIDHYYQCYETHDEDNDDITIITSNDTNMKKIK